MPTAEVREAQRQRRHSEPQLGSARQQEDMRRPDAPLRTLKAHFFRGKLPPRRRTGRAITVLKAIRRTLTPSQKLLLIRARFGSLADFSRP